MIEERRCSYEVCKLLHEKGFDIKCTSWYWENNINIWKPTHQMACDWLQEKHHYIIDVHLDVDGEEATTFVWSIYEKINPEGAEPYARLYYEDDEPYDIDYKEDAINDALEYILKNLI